MTMKVVCIGVLLAYGIASAAASQLPLGTYCGENPEAVVSFRVRSGGVFDFFVSPPPQHSPCREEGVVLSNGTTQQVYTDCRDLRAVSATFDAATGAMVVQAVGRNATQWSMHLTAATCALYFVTEGMYCGGALGVSASAIASPFREFTFTIDATPNVLPCTASGAYVYNASAGDVVTPIPWRSDCSQLLIITHGTYNRQTNTVHLSGSSPLGAFDVDLVLEACAGQPAIPVGSYCHAGSVSATVVVGGGHRWGITVGGGSYTVPCSTQGMYSWDGKSAVSVSTFEGTCGQLPVSAVTYTAKAGLVVTAYANGMSVVLPFTAANCAPSQRFPHRRYCGKFPAERPAILTFVSPDSFVFNSFGTPSDCSASGGYRWTGGTTVSYSVEATTCSTGDVIDSVAYDLSNGRIVLKATHVNGDQFQTDFSPLSCPEPPMGTFCGSALIGSVAVALTVSPGAFEVMQSVQGSHLCVLSALSAYSGHALQPLHQPVRTCTDFDVLNVSNVNNSAYEATLYSPTTQQYSVVVSGVGCLDSPKSLVVPTLPASPFAGSFRSGVATGHLTAVFSGNTGLSVSITGVQACALYGSIAYSGGADIALDILTNTCYNLAVSALEFNSTDQSLSVSLVDSSGPVKVHLAKSRNNGGGGGGGGSNAGQTAGFVILGIVAFCVVVGALGGGGYYMWKHSPDPAEGVYRPVSEASEQMIGDEGPAVNSSIA